MNRLGVSVMAALALLPGTLSATTVQPSDLAEMTRASDLVVRGTVQAIRTVREPSGRLMTEAVLEVQETLAGQAPDTVTVFWPGGELGEEGQWVPGSPRLEAGQEAVLFLARKGPPAVVARYLPVSLAAGVMRVLRLPDRTALVRDLRGLHCPDGLGLPDLPGTLEELRRAVRALGEEGR